ncbi:DUF5977 domain-containing protein [Sphingobacterium paramultivorum]|uniref:DUF5977 domain-containing protein n=1 Tax=Sphingobacterium paramultivorum TaxID=2886510 RepID=UPI00129D1EB4|nr:DUF5977 domain-containing protein [Sphingobacterium paramultivorum]
MKNNLFLLAFIWLMGLSLSVKGQVINKGTSIVPTIISKSPQASSLGNYGLKSIDLFTGKPDITIDLYTIKLGNYSFPIKLSYNTDLVKPNEHPGIMGLGWSLVNGGVINRSVNGGVDEYLSDQSMFIRADYYDDYSVLNRPNWYTLAFLDTLEAGIRQQFPQGPYKERSYPSPDRFSFNVNGLNGSFYKNHLGKWQVTSNRNIDIQIVDSIVSNYKVTEKLYTEFNKVINPEVKRMIYGFKLTDDQGYQYIFGMQPNSIEFSATPDQAATSASEDLVANSWHLTKVILPNTSQSIDFQYTSDQRAILKYYAAYASGNTKVGGYEEKYFREANSIVKNLQVYLDKIKTDEIEINFYQSLSNDLDYTFPSSSSPEGMKLWKPYMDKYGALGSDIVNIYPTKKHWFKLDSMVVKSTLSNERLQKNVPTYLENPSTRLFLTALNLYGNNNQDFKQYSFGYTDTQLPAYGTKETDHQGFFNGRNFFSSVQPDDNGYYTFAQLNTVFPKYKDPNTLSISSKGYLNMISYPTKGTDMLIYEQNSYSKFVDPDWTNAMFGITKNQFNKNASGLRIRKIISYPRDSLNVLTREFFYVNDLITGDTLSSGVLSGEPVYFEKATDNTAFEYFKFRINPILIDNSTNGNHITYTKVYEKDDTGSLIEYTFTNQDNGFGDKPANVIKSNTLVRNGADKVILMNQLKFGSLEHERGQPLRIRYFDDKKKLLKKETYEYRGKTVTANTGIRAIDYQFEFFGKPDNFGGFTDLSNYFESRKMSAYDIYTYHSYLKSKTVVEYDVIAGDSIVTSSDYRYNDGATHQLKNVTRNGSEGKTTRESYLYPTDFQGQSVYQAMVARNMVSTVVVDSTVIGNVLAKQTRTNYGSFIPVTGKTFLLPSSAEHKIKNGPWITDYTVNVYTPNAEIAEIKYPNNVLETYIWGYQFNYPIAKILSSGTGYSAALTLMANGWTATTSPNLSEASLTSALLSLRNKLKATSSQLWTYTYKPEIGMNSETGPSGETIFYDYDSFGRLKYIKELNGHIKKSFDYVYSNKSASKIFRSVKKSQAFTVSCSTGQVGDQITYTVDAGTYYSFVSQVDADKQAQDDINANGQKYANETGGCKVIVSSTNIGMTDQQVQGVLVFVSTDNVSYRFQNPGINATLALPVGSYTLKFGTPGTNALFDINGQNLKLVELQAGGEVVLGNYYIGAPFYIKASTTYYKNVAMTQNFTKNNCPSGQQGEVIAYSVPTGSYLSLISQADADQKATNEINANGQTRANNIGTCKTLVPVTFQRYSSINNFNPVTVEFIPSGMSSGSSYTFPSTNAGTTNESIATGNYLLKFTTPISIPFPVQITLNGSNIGTVPSGQTSTSISVSLVQGVAYSLKINVSNL